MKYTTRETLKTRQLELIDNTGEVAQKVCRSCGFVKLIGDFYIYPRGNARPECKSCHSKLQNKYIRENKNKRKAYRHNERAREVGSPDNLTEKDIQELYEFANGVCMISARKVDNLVFDHVQSLSKNFLGSTVGNIVLVSGEVNLKKRTYSIFEFANSDNSKGMIDSNQLKRTFSYLADKNNMSVSEYVAFLQDCEELAEKNKNYWRGLKK